MRQTTTGSHDNQRELSGNGRDVFQVPSARTWHVPVSFPEQPQMNGGKERIVDLNVSHLCLSENAGLPVAGQAKAVLYGNGVCAA